ncbi:Phosphoribosyltransferase [Nitrospira sp. KM1]|uniref:phosphoribosyltransferase n=1 Tax=Nitrospira sp. KM1 TaxID=1936990 RepID=UPI0013A73FD0|nr:phosphoribosyltransferase [Nitrospira sp. KM1]BCA56025.1 Phosphoribosyltransferase [Nitrospira sp. KM1]
MQRFQDRREAGRILARHLYGETFGLHPVVLALPRGGVPVAFEIAHALQSPLDVLIVRKLGVPGQDELAMGAIASGGIRILHDRIIRQLGLPASVIAEVTRREERELFRRERVYRGKRLPVPIGGRAVIVIDDGLATGATMRAAVAALRQRSPARIIVAVPVAPRESCEELKQEADDVFCVLTPEPFWGVGQWYEDFSQTSDEEVRELLQQTAESSL